MVFDPLIEERVAGGGAVPRDPRSGKPFIVPRGEIEPVIYDRASSIADYLAKDIFGIKRWEMRYLAIGLGRRPDLAALAGSETYTTGLGMVRPLQTPEENRASGGRLDEIIERALDSAGIHEKADAGTVVHTATEEGFAGGVPAELRHMVEAYHELVAGLETVCHEVFVACDELRSAGTFDHAYRIPDQELARQIGEALGVDLTGTIIGDKKTGKNVHVGDFEVQLGGTYAHGEVYQGPPIDGADQRIILEDYFGDEVNRKTGLIVHTSSSGSPKPRILPVNLERGWRLAKTAVLVRDARDELDKIGVPKKVPHIELSLALLDSQLAAAPTIEAARALYPRFKAVWTDNHTLVAKGKPE